MEGELHLHREHFEPYFIKQVFTIRLVKNMVVHQTVAEIAQK